MDFVVDKLIDFSSNKDEELRDISSLGWLFYLVALSLLTLRPPKTFHDSSQDNHSGTPSRKPNRTESLRKTVTEAPTAAYQCKYAPCG
jgi:hypothetical protein